MTAAAFEAWPPEEWSTWSFERRRIWRLEQQLLRAEALLLEAVHLAEHQAREIAALGGVATEPADAVLRRFRAAMAELTSDTDEY